MNNNRQFTVEDLKRFQCIENLEHLYEANKELFGDYDKYINSVFEKYNSDKSDEY